MTSTKNRFMELEGVRGLAAIAVVLHHFFLAFYPFLLTGHGNLQHMRYEDNIRGTPFALLYAGTFAVAIFFVLSGFVLSIGYFQKKDESIVKRLASRRYLRLMLPALASTLLCFLLIKFGASSNIEKTAGLTGSDWLGGTWNGGASLFDAIYSGSIGIFLQSGSFYNNVLWTMMIEFFGSFLVFTFLIVAAKSRYRPIVYALLAIFTFNTWFLPFVIGVLIADLYANKWLQRLKRKSILGLTFLLGAVILGSYPHGASKGGLYELLTLHIGKYELNNEMLFLTIGAAMLILAVLLNERLKTFMSSGSISNLGKYTFSLYLVHLSVIYTVSTTVFISLYEVLGYNLAALVALLVSIPVVWSLTILFERFVDTPSITFAKYVSDIYDGRKSSPSLKAITANIKRHKKIKRILKLRPDTNTID